MSQPVAIRRDGMRDVASNSTKTFRMAHIQSKPRKGLAAISVDPTMLNDDEHNKQTSMILMSNYVMHTCAPASARVKIGSNTPWAKKIWGKGDEMIR